MLIFFLNYFLRAYELLGFKDLLIRVETERIFRSVLGRLLEVVDVVLEGFGVDGFGQDLVQELLFVGLKLSSLESHIVQTLKVLVLF